VPAAELDPAAVAEYLRAHPRFLADNPELYRRLAPPARVHGEAMADHMAAMLRAERAHAAAMSDRAAGVLAAGRAAAGIAARVQEAVLALLASDDPPECVSGEFAAVLGVDAAHLCIEAIEAGTPAGARALPPRAVTELLGTRCVLFRTQTGDTAPEDHTLLHGEAAPLARCDALVRVPGNPPALLALAARDAAALDPCQGTGALAFLGRALAVALGR
jgi:uncharacterized protein YigA (DUF484 family)